MPLFGPNKWKSASTMVNKSRAEKQQEYRALRDADPARRAAYLEKEKKKYQEDKKLKKKTGIKEKTGREQRLQRKRWKLNQATRREKMKKIDDMMTPPSTPVDPHSRDGDIVGALVPVPDNQLRQRNSGRKAVRRDRAKCYKKLAKMETKYETAMRKMEKYKKQASRLKKKLNKNKKSDPVTPNSGTHVDDDDDRENVEPETPRTKTKTLLKHAIVSSDIRRKLTFHHALIEDLKQKYGKKRPNTVASSFTGKLVKKYRFCRELKNQIGLSRRLMMTNVDKRGIKHGRAVSDEVVKAVKLFYERNDVSRMTTGRKETITKKGEKKQKRLLCDTLKTAFFKFKSETTFRTSYSTFCRLRPFWVVPPTGADRRTCQCRQHENLQFLAQALYKNKVLSTVDVEVMAEQISCRADSLECMYGRCDDCKNADVDLANTFREGENIDLASNIDYEQWIPKKNEAGFNVVNKETLNNTILDVVQDFQSSIKRFRRHLFNIRQQYRAYRARRENMKADECLIHIDFSENWLCGWANEIQTAHFGGSHKQATLHTGCLYTEGNEVHPFCTISESIQHDPPAIWEHLKPIIEWINAEYPSVKKVHFFSDGPTTQYRQKKNFYLLTTSLPQFQEVTWNFFEASHGKGAPDGIGGALKRSADSLLKRGTDVDTPKKMYDLLKTRSSIRLFYVEQKCIEDATKATKAIENDLQTIHGTMTLHQVVRLGTDSAEIFYREVSCDKCSAGCDCIPGKVAHILKTNVNAKTSYHHDTADVNNNLTITGINSDELTNTPNIPDTPEVRSIPLTPIIRVISTPNTTQPNNTDTDSNTMSTNLPDGIQKLQPIETCNESLVGRWCVVEYNGYAYPGIIKEIEESDILVKCLNSVGHNRFKWPIVDDLCWYCPDKIITLIDAPKRITKNRDHFAIDEQIWQLIEESL